jgi:hypothetical protein
MALMVRTDIICFPEPKPLVEATQQKTLFSIEDDPQESFICLR